MLSVPSVPVPVPSTLMPVSSVPVKVPSVPVPVHSKYISEYEILTMYHQSMVKYIMADLGGGWQQWTTIDNNGQQWTTIGNNGQQ